MAKTLLKMEDVRERAEIGAYLRQIADRLEADGVVMLRSGEQQVELSIPQRATLEVQVEQDRSFRGKKGETTLELEIEWHAGETNLNRGLEIE